MSQPSAISPPAIRKIAILFTETQLPTGEIPASGILAEALGSPDNKAFERKKGGQNAKVAAAGKLLE
jgi:hypothetical protein